MQEKLQHQFPAFRIAILYLFFGALWILFSDQIADHFVQTYPDSTFIAELQTIKGWLYVSVTALLLYLLIDRHLSAIEKSRRELVLHESRYRGLFEDAPVAICVIDLSRVHAAITAVEASDELAFRQHWQKHARELTNLIHSSNIQNVNSATLRLFEADSLHQLNERIADIFTSESDNIVMEIVLGNIMDQFRHIWQLPMQSLGGKPLTVLLTVSFPNGHDNTWSEVHLVMVDITEQKRVHDELESNRRQLVEAERLGQSGSWNWDFATNKQHWSQQLYVITGQDPSGFEATYENFLSLVHPDDLQRVTSRMAHRDSAEIEFRIIRPDGELRHIVTISEPLMSKDGAQMGMVGLAQDVTDRRRDETEKRQLEAQLRQAQKLESLGALAGGIAHDFNNILTPLYGYTELVMQDLDTQSQIYEDLSHVKKAAIRGKELVQQILSFSRQIEQERKPLLLHHIVNEIVKLLRATVRPNIAIVRECTSEVDVISADPVQIHQVVMNLCVNACHAMSENGGRLTVKIEVVDVDSVQATVISGIEEGRHVCLQVIDTGIGMDEATRLRVFEPFFTTKPTGEGTGLGLSVSRQIVVSHKGNITVESCLGKGSTFSVYLPLAKVDSTDRAADVHSPERGHGRILFVDDEGEITELAKQMLTRLGYHVDTAQDFDSAMNKMKSVLPYDLLITDQAMPMKSGLQLAVELRAEKIRIPIILMTGDGIGLSDEVVKRSGIDAFLSKPFSAFELSQAIQRVLKQVDVGIPIPSQ